MSRRRIVIILAAVAIILCLLVLAIPGSDPADPVAVVAPTPQPTTARAGLSEATEPAPAEPTATLEPTATPAPPTATPTLDQIIVAALGNRNRNDVPATVVEAGEGSMAITFPINDNLFEEFILSSAQKDILTAAGAIVQATGNAYDLTFNGTFSMQDAFGNLSEDAVVRVQLSRTTLSKINWDNLIAVDLSRIADSYWQHPAFSE